MGTKSQANRLGPDASAGAVEKLYRDLYARGTDGVFAVDSDGLITAWNPAMERIMGVEAVRAIGAVARDLLLAAGAPEVDTLLAPAPLDEGGELRDFTRLSPDDDRIHVYEAACARMEGAGAGSAGMVGMVATVRDVTERLRAERTLIDSEHEHRLRFMQSADAIIVIDRDGRYIDANPAASVVTGYSRDEILRMGVPDLSVPEEQPAARERFRDLVATGVSRAERVIKRKDGSLLHVEAHAIALGDGRLQTTVRDISERKLAEARLHQALQKLRFHIERMPFGYIEWTPDMRVVSLNVAAERLFGWSVDEAKGMSWERFVPESDLKRVKGVIGALQGGDRASYSLNRNVCRDGTVIQCEWCNTPLYDQANELTAVVSMVQDVTERELAETQIRHAQKMESLGVLTRGIAHDFGNLLTVVIGNLRMLRKLVAKGDAKSVEHLSLMEQAANKAADLTSHLLAFARTGAHKPERIDLNEVVRSGMSLLRGVVASSIRVDVSLDDTIPPLFVDRNQIEQVVLNLSMNAAEAMPEGGVISIETRWSELKAPDRSLCVPPDNPKPGRRIELVVRDTGQGMDEVTARRIFEPFYTTKVEGHGLGLAAVLGILKQHEAHVIPRSKVGEGASFHVYFPLEPSARAVQAKGDVEIREDFDATGKPIRRAQPGVSDASIQSGTSKQNF